MVIYLDESGDLGFDFDNKKPSVFFVITLLVCKNSVTIKNIEKAVRRTLKNKVNRKNNNKNIKHELKGTETTIKSKQYYYKNIEQDNGWEIYSVVLNKQKLLHKLGEFPIHKNLYNHLARTILEKVDFTNVTHFIHIVIDRCKNNKEIVEFNNYVAEYLAGLLPLTTRIKIDHQTSTDSACLQAVDLFSWGIYKKYEKGDESWYSVYQKRIKIEEEYKEI